MKGWQVGLIAGGAVALGAGITFGVDLARRKAESAGGTTTAGATGSTPSAAIPVQPLGALQVGQTFAHQWQATGGTGKGFTWSVIAGVLPPGLALTTNGLMAGTPTQDGTYTMTVQAGDVGDPTVTATRVTNLTVAAAQSSLAIPVQALGTLQAGKAFSHQWSATGAQGAVTWTITGAVPAGLTLSPTGLMAGTPAASGTFLFTVYATDSTGTKAGRATSVVVLAATVAAPAATTPAATTPTTTAPGTVVYSSGGTPGTPGSTTITNVSGGTAGTSGSVDLQVSQTSTTGTTTSQTYNVQTNPSTGSTSINLKYSSPVTTTTAAAPAPATSTASTTAASGFPTPAQQLAVSAQLNGGTVKWTTLSANTYNPYTGGYGGQAPAA